MEVESPNGPAFTVAVARPAGGEKLRAESGTRRRGGTRRAATSTQRHVLRSAPAGYYPGTRSIPGLPRDPDRRDQTRQGVTTAVARRRETRAEGPAVKRPPGLVTR